MSNGIELSEREQEIIRLVATGASNKEIAVKLLISPNTVKVHLRNIFNKIGVVSRTEATLYAIRNGLVPAPVQPSAVDSTVHPFPEENQSSDQIEGAPVQTFSDLTSQHGEIAAQAGRSHLLGGGWRRWVLIAGATLLVLFISLAAFDIISRYSPSNPRVTQAATPAVIVDRWQSRPVLPQKTMGMAVAVYENDIYVIAGENPTGVTGMVSRYSVQNGVWELRAAKPTPVADALAVLLGEKIYVPGGRLASGLPTNRLEVYDPRRNRWESKAPLPAAISGYALAAFEGNLYLFGGWDGTRSLDSVYTYDPEQDQWTPRTAMPTARAFAGAAVSAGKIFVIGGFDGQHALTTHQVYYPDRDGSGESPWSERAPLAEGRYAMGITTLADFIYLVGGKTDITSNQQALQYVIQQDTWQPFENPPAPAGDHLGLAAFQDQIILIGGEYDSAMTNQHLVYQAIYKVLMPALQKSENQP